MNVRLGSYLLAGAVTIAIVALGVSISSVGPNTTGAVDLYETVYVPDDVLGEPIRPPDDLDQVGVGRVFSESFEDDPFPPKRNTKWSTSDRCAIFPGQGDVVKWGRSTCDASHGSASLWSVGGGSLGTTFACGADYPGEITDPRRRAGCTSADTLLRYFSFDCSNVSHAMRVTFDYKGEMPVGALRIAVGPRNDDGSITFVQQANDFQANTSGQWVRGEVREFTAAAGVQTLVVGIFYIDETGAGGRTGMMIDNLHFDVMQDPNAGLIGSPTAPPTPSNTPRPPTDAPTQGPPTYTPSVTPTASATPRIERIQIPLVIKHHEFAGPAPPRPTSTNTVPPTATSTETPRPSRTPKATRTSRPTETATRTPYPTPTEVPKPDVQIVSIIPRSPLPGVSLEVVRLENLGTAPQDMNGWRLFNKSHSKTCRIPAGVSIAADDFYEIRSGRHATSDDHGMVCDDSYLWGARQDEAQLYNEYNLMVSCKAYDENGFFDCMPSTP